MVPDSRYADLYQALRGRGGALVIAMGNHRSVQLVPGVRGLTSEAPGGRLPVGLTGPADIAVAGRPIMDVSK